MISLAYIFPRKTRCPECQCDQYVDAGRDQRSGGRVCYRRCTNCRSTYRVTASAAHVDRGGDQSEVVVL